jgi:hypothetical protein
MFYTVLKSVFEPYTLKYLYCSINSTDDGILRLYKYISNSTLNLKIYIKY